MVDQLRYYKKKFGFEVSLYVQENDIDERAATILVDLVNNNADVRAEFFPSRDRKKIHLF
jgi:hypothetical protein